MTYCTLHLEYDSIRLAEAPSDIGMLPIEDTKVIEALEDEIDAREARKALASAAASRGRKSGRISLSDLDAPLRTLDDRQTHTRNAARRFFHLKP